MISVRAMPRTPSLQSLAVLSSLTRPHIVALASLACLTFGHVFFGGYPWVAAVFCAIDWFLVNLLNRVVDLHEDRVNAVRGAEAATRNRRILLVLGFTVLGLSFGVQVLAWPALLPWRLAYHALGFAYNWPLLPGGRRIKQLYAAKNLASAAGFLLTVFGYPLSLAQVGPPLGGLLLTGLFFLLFELSYEVVYDLRDRAGDAAAGIRTFPVVHGDRGAVRIVYGLLAASLVPLLLGWSLGRVPWSVAIMGAAPLLQGAWVAWRLRRGALRGGDCVAMTWGAASLFVVWHAWEILGLPGAGP